MIMEVKALLLLVCTFVCTEALFGNKDKILLKDVQVLTLKHNHMTTGRRSSPVPQLSCVGGSAGCSAFTPQVVQCYNRGFDGRDVQWECKTDMDNEFRFGKIEVTCEGYDYPDDPYILVGSCGLEYTLDLTKEGMQKSQGGEHSYYGNQDSHYYQQHNHYGHQPDYHSKSKSSWSDWITLAIVGFIIYGIYKNCVANAQAGAQHGDGSGPGDHWGSDGGGGGNPPPYGFRPDYMPDSCSGTSSGTHTRNTNTGGSSGLGGSNFWTGAAAGGLMGYLFGNRFGGYRRGYGGYNTGYSYARPRYGFSSPSFGGGGGFSSRSGGGFSSGTRTASGFGGTRRR